ncbi:MAG: sigma-70 family RNA polymerase sigma factor [Acidimicrobiales bacterium]
MTPTSPVPDASRREDEETATLWRAWKKDGDRRARERLVHLYYPLVKHVARGLASTLSRQAELDDLEGYGAEGLIDAVDRFDPQRGVQFPTFAAHRIRGAVYDGIRAADWVPRSVRRKAREIQEADAELAAAQGRAPTEEEEAAALDLKLSALRASKAQIAAARVASLDVNEASGGDVPARAAGGSQDEPLDTYLAQEARSMVQTAMYRLPERERAVAAMSFGEGMTLAEIGRTLGVTESRVCQIRASALSRLRIYMSSQGMGPEGEGEGERSMVGASARRAG